MPLYKITETHICCDTYINIEAKDEKEAKKLLNKLKRFFGLPNYDASHRWGEILKEINELTI